MLHASDKVYGYKLHSGDEELGKIEDLYFDDRYWTVRYLVIETGNWLVQRRVLLSPRAILAINPRDDTLATELTKAMIEKSPPPDAHPPVDRQFEIAYNEYYQYSPYWVGPLAWGAYSAPRPPEDAVPLEERDTWNNHLYSARNVTGFTKYAVKGTDGDVGHVIDLLFSDDDWTIRYLVVDTRDWLPGKHVLVPPQWTTVDWEHATISVDLSREALKSAPSYDRGAPPDRDYEAELYRHYCRETYWSDDSLCYQPQAREALDSRRP